MTRKLASIQKVINIEPIEGADKIALATINGWQCVVKKDEFQIGDLAVYFEIDSVPPDSELFSWLWKTEEKPTQPSNFRIRTKKLRGTLSQGLLMPLSSVFSADQSFQEEDDVTDLLQVTKYDPPEFNQGGPNKPRAAGNFPTHLVSKTDETRIQSTPALLWEMAGLPWVATIKLDGSSATYVFDKETQEVFACSRNLRVKEYEGKPSPFIQMAIKYNLFEALKQPKFQDLAIQGELVGPGIQQNKLKLKEHDFKVFRVFNTVTKVPLLQSELEVVCAELGLGFAPVVAQGDSFMPAIKAYADLCRDSNQEKDPEEVSRLNRQAILELLKLAEGKYDGTDNEQEGIVIRPRDSQLYSKKIKDWMSFKTISNRFLLKEKD